MKANELMIGDWVDFYHPYEPETHIGRLALRPLFEHELNELNE